MASLQWQHHGPIAIDQLALTAKLEAIGFELASSDVDSGFMFALANPRKKYARESLSVLIAWSPKRLDGFLVEVRSKEPHKTTKRSQADLLSEILKKDLPSVFSLRRGAPTGPLELGNRHRLKQTLT
jgi:hypothetical protein